MAGKEMESKAWNSFTGHQRVALLSMTHSMAYQWPGNSRTVQGSVRHRRSFDALGLFAISAGTVREFCISDCYLVSYSYIYEGNNGASHLWDVD